MSHELVNTYEYDLVEEGLNFVSLYRLETVEIEGKTEDGDSESISANDNEVIDYKIVMNNIAGKDVAAKLSEKDKEKMLVFIDDHESVTCLILGLAARLAKAEQNIVGREDLIAEEKKREKLADQTYLI